jgi:hypothetical protein
MVVSNEHDGPAVDYPGRGAYCPRHAAMMIRGQ